MPPFCSPVRPSYTTPRRAQNYGGKKARKKSKPISQYAARGKWPDDKNFSPSIGRSWPGRKKVVLTTSSKSQVSCRGQTSKVTIHRSLSPSLPIREKDFFACCRRLRPRPSVRPLAITSWCRSDGGVGDRYHLPHLHVSRRRPTIA